MKFRTVVNIAVGLIVLEALIALSLLNANRDYKVQNRHLIIQNDSILSVNLELSRRTQTPGKNISEKN
jgi:hypothetical protein